MFMRRWALPFGLYTLAALLLFHRAWETGLTQLIGLPGSGDPYQTASFLGWVPFAVREGHNPLLSDYIGYGQPVNLMWNTAVPALGLILWPLTAAAGVVVSYDVALTLAVVTGALAAYALALRLTGHEIAALVAGALYGLSPYEVGHALGHLNLCVIAGPPVVCLLVLRAVGGDASRLWTGIILGAVAVVQFFVSEEVLVTEGIAGAVLLGALAVSGRADSVWQRVQRLGVVLGVALALFIPCVAIPVAIQLRGPGHMDTVHPAGSFSGDIARVVVPDESEWISPVSARSTAQHFEGGPSEQTGYLGIPLVLALGVGVIALRRVRAVRVAGIAAACLFVLSLGNHLHVAGTDTHVHLPGALLAHVPLVGSALPARFSLYVLLAAAMVVAWSWGQLSAAPARIGRGGRLALGLALMPLLPRPDFPSAPVGVPGFFTSGAAPVPAGSSALIVPYVWGGVGDEPMVWQAAAKFRFQMPEGYYLAPASATASGYGPSLRPFTQALVDIQAGKPAPRLGDGGPTRETFLGDLGSLHVSSVVVGPMAHQDDEVAFITALLGRPPTRSGGVALWSGV